MKKWILLVLIVSMGFVLTACTEADKVSANISKEADNFNVIRRITVINMRTDKPIFELVGQFSLGNTATNELKIICQTGENEFKKHYVYLNDWMMYVVEDLCGSDVSPYKYEINFLPEMIVPFTFTSSY